MSDLFLNLRNHARQSPGKIALRQCIAGGATIDTTYGQLAESAQAFGELFRQQESARIVPIYLPKSTTCVAAMFGAQGAGKMFACLNRKLRAPQIREVVRSIGPTVGLVDGPGVLLLDDLKDELNGGWQWWVVRGEAFSLQQERATERISQRTAVNFWPQDANVVKPIEPSVVDMSQAGCGLFTSGSTGTPKGVLISSFDLDARAAAESDLYSLTAEDVLLNILPFSFDVGLNQLLSAISAGCQLVLMESWLPVDILKTAAALKITGISAVPAIWSDMLTAGLNFDRAAAHRSLRYITISGGDLPNSKLDRLPTLADGAAIFKTYGQSETFRSAALLPSEFDAKRQTVGRPFAGAKVYVVHGNNSRCDPMEEGEIVHTGLGTMTGYLDGDNRDKLRDNPFHGPGDPNPKAVFTGDYGYLDQDGYLVLRGRKDAMVKIAGNRVYPREIVEQLSTLPEIADAEVAAVESTGGQTILIAFVTLAAGSQRSASELRRDLSARLPSYMIPARVVVLTALPRTASGKPDRPALIEMANALDDVTT